MAYHQTASNLPCSEFGRTNEGVIVVNQQPVSRPTERFPLELKLNTIFIFSVCECVIAFLLFFLGIAKIVTVDYITSYIAFPVWCGLIMLANGIIGCILKWKQTQCLIAFFFALSIASFILANVMLISSAITLGYFVSFNNWVCTWSGYSGYDCHSVIPSSALDVGIGLSAFLLFLVVCEWACALAATILSCKAYSKCCTSCDTNDCCSCVGCGECDCIPLNAQGPSQTGGYHGQPMQIAAQSQQSSQPPAHQASYGFQNPSLNVRNVQQVPYITTFQPNAPTANEHVAQSNPCSGFLGYFINIPHMFGTAQGDGRELSAVHITIQPVPANPQVENAQKEQLATGYPQ